MHKEVINQVADIDREAFPTMWPPVNYQRELQNQLAHYIMVCDEERTEEPRRKSAPQRGFSRVTSRVRQLFGYDRFVSSETLSAGKQYVIGFAGFWIMADEAHILNIAVRETYRRRGVGELLLIYVLDLAIELDARIATLEVRPSNTVALSLYYKYGFIQVGLRPNYYIDNREDAILMTVENITSASFQAHLQQLKQSHSRNWGIPQYKIAP